MTALIADANVVSRQDGLKHYPIAANVRIFKGSHVCISAAGYAVVGAIGAGRYVGVAFENVDNTLVGNVAGGKNIRVMSGRHFNLVGTGFAQSSVGQIAYLADSGAVTLTPNANPVGMITEYVSATQVAVYVPDPTIALSGAGNANGYRTASGQFVTVTASDTIVTGLGSTLIGVVATLDDDPALDPGLVSASIGTQAGAPAAGSILIKTWKFTSVTNPTPIAATVFGKKVNWIAFGV